jgi:hypothetical protein
MHRAGLLACSVGSLLAAGCASSGSAPTAPSQPPAQSAGAEEPAALDGLWVEFWALEGHADTQRFALFPDGRFGWCAAREGTSRGARRWGTWSVQADSLVLQVKGQDSGKNCADASCRVRHDPPLQERLPIGVCPPNEEAKVLDASYRCISIAGQAFWRRATDIAPPRSAGTTPPQGDDPAGYFPD